TISAVSIDNPTRGEELITSKNLILAEDIQHLYQFLIANRMIIDIPNVKKEWLWINSQIVVRMIRENEPGWEEMVPQYIVKVIKERRLFGMSEKKLEDRI
ncbi:MAG: hypothetical protein R6W71_00700, partial [Bacteroidales bacterium]